MSTINDLKTSIFKIDNFQLASNINDNLNKLIDCFNSNISNDESICKSSNNFKNSPLLTLPNNFHLNLKYPFITNSLLNKEIDESLLFKLNSANSNLAQQQKTLSSKSNFSSKAKNDSFNVNGNITTQCTNDYVHQKKGNTNFNSADAIYYSKRNNEFNRSPNIAANTNIFDTFNNNLLKSFGIESQSNLDNNGTISLKDMINHHI